jgi:acyl-CoA synthetase (NDP forming)
MPTSNATRPHEPRPHERRDVSGRLLALRDVDLDVFLHPRTVAVVGASDASRKPNTLMTARIKAFADANGATFYPVTPSYPEVQGVPTYASIADVPGDVDLAVLLTGAERVVDNFEEAVRKKAKFAVIFSAGFSEIGPAGEALEARLAALAHGGDTRLLGPNTNLNAFSDFRTDLEGPAIALVTQSGHQGRPIFQGQELGIRLSHWAPTGNEVDLEFADWTRYFADQPDVGVVAAYIEGFKDGRSLMLAADHAAKLRKPLVIVKVGKTEAGASMAQSHTGHLTGSDAVTSAVFRQFGVTRVDGLDELLDVSAAFARTKAMKGKRANDAGVCVYAISGGTGAHMADMASAAGLRLPDLTKKTQKILHDGLIPSYLRVSNPVDCGGPPVMTPAGRKILDAIVADPNVDILIIPITGALESMSAPMVRDIVAVAETTEKPIFVVWGSPVGTEPAYVDGLLKSQVPVFRTFANCVRAVRSYLDYWSFVARYESPFDDAPTKPLSGAKKARAILATAAPGAALNEWSSKQILRAYGIKTTNDVLCRTPAEAVKAAKAIGFPVVMKVSSPDLLHKSDAGLVRVGVVAPKEVRAVHEELLAKAKRADRKARIEGVLVSEMVTGGVETLVGISNDPLFGPVVTVGLGGIFVEVLHDVTFRVPPFHRDEAQRMVDELQGVAMLRGARGTKPVDESALVDTIMKVQRLALDLADDIAELDANPLVVRSRGAVALDALVVRK